MQVEHIFENKKYTLSNSDLKIGDKVYPIGWGKCEGSTFLFREFDFNEYSSGFPNDPHVIANLNYSDYKPYEISTSHGYGPKETYFKIINIEMLSSSNG